MQPRSATVEEVEAAAARVRSLRLGVELSADVQATIREIRQARLSAKRLGAWLLHPDESVGIAAVDRISRESGSERTLDYRKLAFLRALEINEAEGLLWNPLLDRLHATGKAPGEGRDWQVEAMHPFAVPPHGHWAASQHLQKLLNGIVVCITQESAAADVQALLQTRSLALRKHIGRYARGVPDSLVDAARTSAALAQGLVHNHRIRPEQISRLRTDVLTMLLQGKDAYGGFDGAVWDREPTAMMVAHFASAGQWGRSEAIDTLLAFLPRERDPNERFDYRHSSLIRAVCTVGTLNETHARHVVPYVDDVSWLPEWLLKLKAAPIEVVLEAVQRVPGKGALLELVRRRPEMGAHPDIARVLPSEGIPENVWGALIRHSHGPAFRFAVREALARNPEDVLQRLAERIDDARVSDSLYATDLAPALSSPDAAVREAALRLVGRLQQGEPVAKRRGR
jgi:hypothetical protein